MCIKDNIKQNVPSVRNREQEVLIELLWQVLSGNCVLWTRICHVLSCLSHASVTNSLGAKQIDKVGLWRSQTQPGAAAYADIKPYHTIHYSFPERYSKGSGRGTQSMSTLLVPWFALEEVAKGNEKRDQRVSSKAPGLPERNKPVCFHQINLTIEVLKKLHYLL